MLRTVGPQGSLFELLLPAGMRVLSGELAEIDVLLDDDRYFRPFRPFFDPVEGRPSIPIETYLRLMFLKYRFDLGYARLCVQVDDSIVVAPVLSDRARGVGAGRVDDPQDHSPLRPRVDRGVEPRVLRRRPATAGQVTGSGAGRHDRRRGRRQVSDRLGVVDRGDVSDRVDGCDGWLAVGVKVDYIDRSAAARAHQHSIGAWLRRRTDEAKAEVLAITGLLADLADASVAEAMIALPYKARRRRVRRMLDDLAVLVERTDGSSTRPAAGSTVTSPTGRPGWCRCTNPTPARSAKAASASRSSSVTRPRSSTTSTGSSSITACTSATRPTTGCCARRSNVSTPPSGSPRRSPQIVATGTQPSKRT